ncbi:MAG: GNAT family N-acetyltransferase [Lachnospiraceae bacterium]|nr:GNAT family N-acetyltransferase [Lachnospiraceae bacterium]
MEVNRIEYKDLKWNELIEYAENCSWIAGKHLASMMRDNTFDGWESVFAATAEDEIIGFCTFLKTDYYPENRYSPWVSSIFVDEKYRGKRISERMINKVIEYAKEQNFSKVYIPSDMIGMYEKYGFQKIDELQNYDGDIDNILQKKYSCVLQCVT